MLIKLTKGENGKKAITFFQQYNFRVVQLEFDKWRPLSKMIPTNLLQHPMSGKPTWLPGYWEADGDLTGVGEGDVSNSSSWWDDASSDGRCGGVGLGGAFFLEEDFFAGLLGDFFPLPRPRPLPAIRRIWWDWSKGMISIYNNAVVDCRDTVEEWRERRLPASFYTLWIDVMRSPTNR